MKQVLLLFCVLSRLLIACNDPIDDDEGIDIPDYVPDNGSVFIDSGDLDDVPNPFPFEDNDLS